MDVYNQQYFFGPDNLHRSHLSDARTWTHNDAIVTLSWAGDRRRFAVSLAERVKLQVLRSRMSLSLTETIESAKMPTVAQMEEITIKGRPKDSNSEGQTNIRQL